MDKDFFVQQVDELSGTLYRVAYSLLRSPDDCRDAMQEAALKAWEKRYALRDASRFSPWLIRILVNECRNIQRKRRPTVPLENVPEPMALPPDPTLALALQTLPERLRLPLVLQYAEGMSYGQIAQALRVPESTVRGRIHRAKELLRKELAE